MKIIAITQILFFMTCSILCLNGLAADITKWHYHEPTGLLTGKEDAAGNIVSYTYEIGNRLKTRKWARLSNGNAFTTTYTYDQNTAELLRLDYSDHTPGIVFTYDRLGRYETITDALGTRVFGYNKYLQLETETISGFYNEVIKLNYATSGVKGRYTGFTLEPDHEIIYGFDNAGRINSVSWNIGSKTGTVNYSYLANSDLIKQMTSSDGNKAAYSYEAHRDIRTQVKNQYGSTVISQYDYSYDNLGRKIFAVNSGHAFAQAAFSKFRHNERSELTGSDRYLGTDINDLANPLIGEHRVYDYDPIGNRKIATEGASPKNYVTNNLNQYEKITVNGNAISANYDADGNLTSLIKDGKETLYRYDAENRLIEAEPANPAENDQKSEYIYDFMGRRVKKTVFAYVSGDWQSEKEILFAYDGWNLIRETVREGGNENSRYFVWGLDISHSLQEAGGIGGLVACIEGAKTYYYAHDANGNVGQITDSSNGFIVAAYEYDPFGIMLKADGIFAADNPFRFSTKYYDAETGLIYYGHRYYSPELGRWLNRDPIEEYGSLNLYCFAFNNPNDFVDPFGDSLISFFVKMGAKQLSKGILKNFIKTKIKARLKKLTVKKFKTKLWKQSDNLYDLLEDSWWETCIGLIPIAGDAFEIVNASKKLKKLIRTANEIERKVSKILEIQNKYAHKLLKGRFRSVEYRDLANKTYKELTEMKSAKAKTMVKLIEQEHRLMQKVR